MKISIIFYFYNSPNFIITFPTKTDFSDKFIEFFYENSISCDYISKNYLTKDLLQNIKDFFSNNKFSRDLSKQFIDVIQAVPINSPFFILVNNGQLSLNEINIVQKDICNAFLSIIPQEIREEYEEFNIALNSLEADFDLNRIHCNFKLLIGKDKNKICRFCNKDWKHTTFRKKAHSISEAIGNKKVFTLDECDTCNEFFGSTIEKSFITFINVYRIVSNTKGKKGNIKIHNNSIHIENIQTPPEVSNIIKDENIILVVSNKSKESKNLLKIPLGTEKLIPMDIYRTLCKYVISLLSNEYLEYYQSTIKWIKKEYTIPNDKLFRIWYNIIPQNYAIPELTIYIRKEKDNIPRLIIGELFTCILHFIFIIPNDNLSQNDIVTLKNYSYFQKKISKLCKLDITIDKIVDYNSNINISTITN